MPKYAPVAVVSVMALYGTVWHCLALRILSGPVWHCLALYGLYWPCVAPAAARTEEHAHRKDSATEERGEHK